MKHEKEKTLFFAFIEPTIVFYDGNENLYKFDRKDDNCKAALNQLIVKADTIVHGDSSLYNTLRGYFDEENQKRFKAIEDQSKPQKVNNRRGGYGGFEDEYESENETEDDDEEIKTAIEDCLHGFSVLYGQYNKKNKLKIQSLATALEYYGIEIDGELDKDPLLAAVGIKRVWDAMNPNYYS